MRHGCALALLLLVLTPGIALAADPAAPDDETPPATPVQDALEALQRRSTGIREENATLQQRIAALEQGNAALRAQHAAQDRKLAELRARLDALEAARDD